MRCHLHRMLSCILIMCSGFLSAQNWSVIDPQNIMVTGKRDIIPQQFKTYHIDYEEMKSLLWSTPNDYLTNPSNSNTIIRVGLADGTADLFRMVQYDIMEAPLAAYYPGIKAFKGISVSNPYRTIRVDWTKRGFRAVISDLEGKTYIDHYQRNDMANCIVYFAKDFSRPIDWSCGTEEDGFHDSNPDGRTRSGDCEFRSYRLAVATTGEYSNYFGATSPSQSDLVMSEVVTAVNRVNEVYETDFSTRLILIENTDDVFYYDPAGDPFSGSACNQLNQNQSNMTSVIGSANYDVGHVFSVGSGGCAGLGVICNNSNKARGATGLNPPTGDPFYIDYVAHELGHQFGGNHTQNNNCNRVSAAAMEPGSASTIMGYAGICPPNVQNNSDDYFHAYSLQEINNKISSSSCEAILSLENSAPVVSNFPNYSIPKSTPFVLTAVATDADGDPLTYCWEQWDNEVGTMPPTPTNTVGPMFRSLLPSASPSRYFPNLPSVIEGTNPTWEVLPSVGRAMEFRITVRDLFDGAYGCTDEDNTIITTVAAAGPFVVTSQSSPTTWLEGASETVTWNVANTTASPINCATVDIFLSLDGGVSFPVLVAEDEPNDGSALVTIPPGTTDNGRIMVKAAENVFYNVNEAAIAIEPGLPNYTLALNPISVTECNDGSVETVVEVGQFMGFTDPVTLSMLNLPPGATASFDPMVVLPGNNSTLTISNLGGLFGMYTSTVRGVSTTGIKEAVFTIDLLEPPSTAPTLLNPTNNNTETYITPLLEWQSISDITAYDYEIAFDEAFDIVAQSGEVFTNQFQVTNPLAVDQEYFWRIRAKNSCGGGDWSSVFTFTTIPCFAVMSTDVPVNIPVNGATTVYSTLNTAVEMEVGQLEVINLTGTHSWVDDLEFSLISPDNTELLFWDQPCDNHDNFDINFSDSAPDNNWPCPPTDGGTYIPDGLLSAFIGKMTNGEWTLKIQDVYTQADGGNLNSWGIKVCGDLLCQLTVTELSGSELGSLAAAITCASSGDTIWLAPMLSGDTIDIGAFPILLNKDIVIMADGVDISVSGSGSRIFEVEAGSVVEINGVRIIAGTAVAGGAINNPGSLTLKDVTIDKNPATEGAVLIQNVSGGSLFIEGDCLIQQ